MKKTTPSPGRNAGFWQSDAWLSYRCGAVPSIRWCVSSSRWCVYLYKVSELERTKKLHRTKNRYSSKPRNTYIRSCDRCPEQRRTQLSYCCRMCCFRVILCASRPLFFSLLVELSPELCGMNCRSQKRGTIIGASIFHRQAGPAHQNHLSFAVCLQWSNS